MGSINFFSSTIIGFVPENYEKDFEHAVKAYQFGNPNSDVNEKITIHGILASYIIVRNGKHFEIDHYDLCTDDSMVSCNLDETSAILGIQQVGVIYLVKVGILELTEEATRITHESINRYSKERVVGKVI